MEKLQLGLLFQHFRPYYERLCEEVRYVLEKCLEAEGIDIASISCRAKSMPSFRRKIRRRLHVGQLSDITDLAGVRVVCLYRSDLAKIDEIIRKEFQVKEKVDKLEEQGADRFGYGAIHFLVSLGKKFSGARYDDLKGLLCEIQTRTVAQDAWATISHHLLYKQQSAAPSALQRKLNSLAGVFEIADHQFDAIRVERETYLREIEERKETPDILAQELNLDTLMAYAEWKFPEIVAHTDDFSEILGNLDRARYTTIGDIDGAVARAARAVEDDERRGTSGTYEDAGDYITMALGFTDAEYRQRRLWTKGAAEALDLYEHLVDKNG